MARAATYDEVVLGVLVYEFSSRDFDVPRLVADMKQRHPRLAKFPLAWFVPFCVFTCYLR